MSDRHIKITLLLFAFIIVNSLHAQDSTSILPIKKERFYFDVFIGSQVSGIRKEDYVSSNLSPYIQLSAGKLITPTIAINLNFQGLYFNFIGDNRKHFYQFIGSDIVLNLNNLLCNNNTGIWKIYLFTGPGILFNNYLNKINFCINGGVINEFKFNKISLKFKISAIAGYRIYQHDKDILTNISIGLSRYF